MTEGVSGDVSARELLSDYDLFRRVADLEFQARMDRTRISELEDIVYKLRKERGE